MTSDGILVTDRLVTGTHDWAGGWIEIQDGHIVALGEGEPAATAVTRITGTIIPGFVDIHAHGALGFDFARSDADGARTAARHHATRGTTTLVASIASGASDATIEALERLAPLVQDETLAGIHLEGPYLSPARRGAHNPTHLRTPDLAEMRGFLDSSRGTIRCVTIAPELEGAEAMIRMLSEHDVVAAIGHTDCTAEVAHAAVAWGATHVTHLYNGMPELRHREPGPVGATLLEDSVTIELILDGVHLAPEAAAVARRAATDRLVLVSDAMEATGLPDGDYEISGSRVVVENGTAMLADRSSLAGSTKVIADCFPNLLALDGMTILEAVRATSITPARALGLPHAGLEPGAPADLLVVGDGSASFVVREVMRRGEWLASSF